MGNGAHVMFFEEIRMLMGLRVVVLLIVAPFFICGGLLLRAGGAIREFVRYIATNFVIEISPEARWLQGSAILAGFMASLSIRGHHGGPPSDPLIAWLGSYGMIFLSVGVLGAYLVHTFRDAEKEKKKTVAWLPSTNVV